MSRGFCPHDWHGTTEADLRQMSWGEDYDFWADVAATERVTRRAEQLRRIDAEQPSAPIGDQI